MSQYTKFAVTTRQTPQCQQAPGKNQVLNNAGGYVFKTSDFDTFRRFLILGSEGGTYYASGKTLTRDNAQKAITLFGSKEGPKAVELLAEVSDKGLAPKVSPALFALALAFAYGTKDTRLKAVRLFNTVVRTQSHLFEFVSYVDNMRGWGRLLRETVANWYNSKDVNVLGYQMVKYRNRNNWTTKDVLRMAHPKAPSEAHNALYGWAVEKEYKITLAPKIVTAHTVAMNTVRPCAEFIKEHKLTHEMIPNTWLNEPSIWESLLPNMPATALLRNLNKTTAVGLTIPRTNATKFVVSRLTNQEYLQKNRVHPFSVLLAMETYKAGRGVKGNLQWSPTREIVDALDEAFYLSFKNIKPTGKSFLIALDVSGSMDASIVNTHISSRTAATAMAMCITKIESNYEVVAFTSGPNWNGSALTELSISSRQRLDDIVATTRGMRFGGTDCALPFIWALENGRDFSCVLTLSDNESWEGPIHVHQALNNYRKEINPNTKFIAAAFSATNYTVADPDDHLSLNIVGLDASMPQLVSNFVTNKF